MIIANCKVKGDLHEIVMPMGLQGVLGQVNLHVFGGISHEAVHCVYMSVKLLRFWSAALGLVAQFASTIVFRLGAIDLLF